MATSFQAHVHKSFESPTTSFTHTRWVPGIPDENGASSISSSFRSSASSSETSTALNDLSRTLEYRKSHMMDPSSINSASHERILDWIRSERMRKLPPEGSSYDKVLVRARLFVERLYSFELGVQPFAGDSQTATQLAYIYCATLLRLGEENSEALMDLFSFFYRCSTDLHHLMGRAELFPVSRKIRDQVTLAVGDLVTLVVEITSHFQKSLTDITSGSVAIDIHNTFSELIESFQARCDDVAELMWQHQVSQEGLGHQVTDVKTLREWLQPEDTVLEHITKYTSQFAQDREESTCLWVAPHLTRFMKGDQKTLAITGKPGSGKSILATVINDHLQSPIGGVSYQSIFVPINGRIPALTTPQAVAKTILSELFAVRIGNVGLYKALSDTYQRCTKTVNDEEYADLLWAAVKSGLHSSMQGSKPTVLIVDGTDESTCGQDVLLKGLRGASADVDNLKLIVTGSEKHNTFPKQSTVNITPDLISDDVAAVVRTVFDHCPAYNSLSAEDQEVCVHRIVKAAEGSFLWAKLAAKRIRDENTSKTRPLVKDIGSFVKANHNVNDLVYQTLKSNASQAGVKIVAWLATAARPLTISELSSLLSIQPDKDAIVDQKVAPLNLLKPFVSLVFCQNNMVYLRHGQLRSAICHIIDNDKSIPAIKDTQLDLIRRMAVYIKHTVTGKQEPSLDTPDPQQAESLVEKHPFLDFSLRYWLGHTRIAFGCDSDQEISKAGQALTQVFPGSPLVPRLEMTVWKRKPTPSLLSLYTTQARLYQQVLGTRDPATLQATLCQALFFQKIQDVTPSQASEVFYNAAKICQSVLTVHHLITMRMTKHFLDFTERRTTGTKSEIMTRRTEMLQVLVECYKVHYGASSEMVVSTLTQLSEHYRAVGQVHKAQEITTIIQGSTVESHQDTTTARRPSEQSLVVQLHGRKDSVEHGTVLTLDESFQDDIAITTTFNLQSLLSKAEKEIREGNLTAAERTYVDIWQQTSKDNRVHNSTESELRNIKAITAYSDFLRSQRRDEEVASVLSSFWEEHGQSMSSSQEVVSQFTGIAKRMRSVGLSSQALSVLKQCSQRTSREGSLYKEIQESTVSTSEEVLQGAGSSTSGMTESDLQEMANSGSDLSATAIDKLVKMYMSQHRWKDATRTLKQALQGAWPAFFVRSINDVVFPRSNVQYSIDLAQRLRLCYRYRRNPAKEEDVCLRLYNAVKRDRKIGGNELFDGIAKGLVNLYERSRQTEKLVSIHNDILKDYTNRFGDGHPAVLKQLWTLADLTRPGAECVDYYQRIFDILNKNSDTCRPEAFECLVLLMTELFNQKRYKAALQPCSILFKTLHHPNINSKLRSDRFVKSVYERYVHCLHMTNAEFRVIHDVTAEYRRACLSVFGIKAVITIEATKTLAHICQTSKEYEAEAVQLYEELLKTESDVADIDYEDIRATIDGITEEREGESNTNTTTSKRKHQTVTTSRRRLTTILSTYGWAHEASLSQMEELVSLYATQNDTQSATILLHDAASHILKSDSSSADIIKAAKTIAVGYREIGQLQRARELAQDIHRQVITGDSSSAKYSITSSKHQSLLFLAQLEYSLRDGRELSLTMNEIYSSLMAESVYSERFRTEARSKSTSLQGILPTVSHLEELFNLRGDAPSSQLLMERFTDYFMSREGEVLDLNRRQATVFLSTILEHFRTHSSQNFLRSVALASHDGVVHLLSINEHQAAADLALASFRYVHAHDGFATMTTMKLVFKMGLAISAWVVQPQSGSRFEQDLINVSETICKEMLRHCKGKNIDLSQLDAVHLNNLIKVLDKKKDYTSLSWLLTSLWTKRQISHPPQANGGYTLALGRMLVVTRYLVGEYTAAIRLAEDIVYNCARVHGPTHPSTVEMSVLLSQMYTSVAQGYQNKEDQRELAYQYYKKAAGLHENSLRALIDPSSASIAGTDGSTSPSSSEPSSPGGENGAESSGKRAKKHLHLLKLAIERLGNWPKEYKEYEQLNSDLFTAFGNDLKGVEGVDKWNLKQFGSGRAEASDDLIALKSYPRLDLNSLAITV